MGALRKYLTDNHLDLNKFGRDGTKTLKELSRELIKGEASLMKNQENQLVRIVDVVVLVLKKVNTNDILVEIGENRGDGQEKKYSRLPGAKRRPDENQFITAR